MLSSPPPRAARLPADGLGHRRIGLLAAASVLALLAPLDTASAQVATPPASAASAPGTATLPAVSVRSRSAAPSPTGPDYGYQAPHSASATKTDTPLRETPQSVTVVTRDRLEDMGAQGLQEALNYAAGVHADAFGLDTKVDWLRVRGTAPDEYLDGLRQTFGFYTTTRPDPYMLERIEVLRGPSAMLYGQGSTGGVVNLVSKRPLQEARREIDALTTTR